MGFVREYKDKNGETVYRSINRIEWTRTFKTKQMAQEYNKQFENYPMVMSILLELVGYKIDDVQYDIDGPGTSYTSYVREGTDENVIILRGERE